MKLGIKNTANKAGKKKIKKNNILRLRRTYELFQKHVMLTH